MKKPILFIAVFILVSYGCASIPKLAPDTTMEVSPPISDPNFVQCTEYVSRDGKNRNCHPVQGPLYHRMKVSAQ